METGNAQSIFAGEPLSQRPLGRPGTRLYSIINMNVREMV